MMVSGSDLLMRSAVRRVARSGGGAPVRPQRAHTWRYCRSMSPHSGHRWGLEEGTGPHRRRCIQLKQAAAERRSRVQLVRPDPSPKPEGCPRHKGVATAKEAMAMRAPVRTPERRVLLGSLRRSLVRPLDLQVTPREGVRIGGRSKGLTPATQQNIQK